MTDENRGLTDAEKLAFIMEHVSKTISERNFMHNTLQEIFNLHENHATGSSGNEYCTECADVWPCRTMKVISGIKYEPLQVGHADPLAGLRLAFETSVIEVAPTKDGKMALVCDLPMWYEIKNMLEHL